MKIFLTSLRKNLDRSPRLTLSLGFGTVILLFVVMLGLALTTLDAYHESLTRARQDDNTALAARNVRDLLRAEALVFTDLLVRQEADLEISYRTLQSLLDQQFEILQKSSLGTNEQNRLTQLTNYRQQLIKLYDNAFSLTRLQKFDQATNLWTNEIQPIVDLTLNTATELASLFATRANTSADQAAATVSDRQPWIITALVVAVVLGIIVTWFTTKTIVNQNNRLLNTLTELNLAHQQIHAKQKASEEISLQVLQLAEELQVIAVQQANGSHEQLAVVTQINTAVNDLAVSATNIAGLAEQVNQAAVKVTQDSQQVDQYTDLTVNESQHGLQKVARTRQSSKEVAQLYQHLVEILNKLNTKSDKMRRILQLLSSIAAEIHLLSLNAAIEAAGAGEYGERFTVVAQEVKNLAGRANSSNKEIVEIIGEIEKLTLEAVDSAQAGYDKAQTMELISDQAGEALESMQQVSQQSQQQAKTINLAAYEVNNLSDVIKSATLDQQTASSQVLAALSSLSVVAQTHADGSRVVSSTATHLSEVSEKLTRILVV